MRIGIVGAGAIGGWIGVRLAKAGHEVSVLARGATLEALAGPWTLDLDGAQLQADVTASDNPAILGVQDVVVVALKGPALAAVAPSLRPMIGPNTLIVPAMNGVPWWFILGGAGELGETQLTSVDPDGAIAAALPYDQVIGCVVHASVATAGAGRIAHRAGNRLILGEPAGASTPRLQRLAAAFRDAGFEVEASPRIKYDIWYKLWGNMTMNPISAFTGATADKILDDELVNGFILRVMSEAQDIGVRIGCPINERGADRNGVTRQLGAFKTSMLQDAEAGRPLEIDQLVGAPREIAAKLGMQTPNIDTLLGLVRLYARNRQLYPA